MSYYFIQTKDKLLCLGAELILLELQHIQTVISALLGEELKVITLLYDLAMRKYDDLIGVLNGRKAVSDDKHSAYRLYPLKRVLNKQLGLRINICSSLIKYDDRGLVNYRSGKGEELALACGEVVTPLAHLLVKSARKLIYKVVRVNVLTGSEDLIIRDGLVTKNDIGAYSTREEEYVLEHLAEVTAQGRELDMLNINAVDKDLPLLNIIIAAD